MQLIGGCLYRFNLFQIELIAGIFLPIAVPRVKRKALRFQFPRKVIARRDGLPLHQLLTPKP
jgi:hypothetical protein